MIPYLGEIAGLSAALCWSVGAVFWMRSVKAFGPGVVNRLRLGAATGFLALGVACSGGAWPWELKPGDAGLLALSGVLGLSLGDVAYFHALPILGPRLAMLAHSLWPAVAALLGWILLGETLSATSLAGMALALAFTVWVAAERSASGDHATAPPEGTSWSAWRLRGLSLSALAMSLQAGGYVVAKMGAMGTGSLSATFTRMSVATAVTWTTVAARGQLPGTFRTVRARPRGCLDVLGGALIGTAVGVWLALLASQHTQVGIAGTLISTGPIWMIPVSRVFLGERPSIRSMLGTLGATAGIALLILGK